MTVTKIFPLDFFIKIRPPNFQEILSEVNKIESKVDLNEKNVHSWGGNCNVKTVSLDKDKWIPFLNPAIKQFSVQVGINHLVSIDDPWINFYKRNYFQEVHHHANSDFATVLCLNSGENFAKFYFQNRLTGLIPPKIKELAGIGDSWYPSMEPGDMLFFPSYLLHGVTPHQSDDIRKTLSFNITI